MKISKEKAASNRRRIIETAMRSFQSKGVESVGLNDLMKDCGFTHGGFYNHFQSKDELVAEALSCAFEPAVQRAEEAADTKEGLMGAVKMYLSAEHRDRSGYGCPSAGFLCDIGRQSLPAREIYAEAIERYIRAFEKQMSGSPKQKRQSAISTFATMVGAMLLSRGIGDANDALSDEVLQATKDHILKAMKDSTGNSRSLRPSRGAR